MATKNSKQRLVEVMRRLDKTFKEKINENISEDIEEISQEDDDIDRDNPHYELGELQSKYNSLLKDVQNLSDYLNQNPDIGGVKGFVNGILKNI